MSQNESQHRYIYERYQDKVVKQINIESKTENNDNQKQHISSVRDRPKSVDIRYSPRLYAIRRIKL